MTLLRQSPTERIHAFVPRDDSPYGTCARCRGGRLNEIHDVAGLEYRTAVRQQLDLAMFLVLDGQPDQAVEILKELREEI